MQHFDQNLLETQNQYELQHQHSLSQLARINS